MSEGGNDSKRGGQQERRKRPRRGSRWAMGPPYMTSGPTSVRAVMVVSHWGLMACNRECGRSGEARSGLLSGSTSRLGPYREQSYAGCLAGPLPRKEPTETRRLQNIVLVDQGREGTWNALSRQSDLRPCRSAPFAVPTLQRRYAEGPPPLAQLSTHDALSPKWATYSSNPSRMR